MKNSTAFSVIIGLVMIGVVVVGSYLLSRDTQQKFTLNSSDALQETLKSDYIFSASQFAENTVKKDSSIVLIDLRSKSKFDKGHLADAINIYGTTILKEDNIAFFDKLKLENKQAVLYGEDAIVPNTTYMILKQMGIGNVKVLEGNYDYFTKNNITDIPTSKTGVNNDELALTDFSKYIKEENTKAIAKIKLEKEKKIITAKKRTPIKKKNIVVKKIVSQPDEEEEEEDEGC